MIPSCQHLNHDNVQTVSVFETTIRSLGGLLSAYDLSGDFAFLEKADDLGSRLLKAFDSPSGIPYGQVHLQTGKASNIAWVAHSALLAEYATLQVEFRYLARATGKKEYAIKAERIFEIIEDLQPQSGLLSFQTLNLQHSPRFQGSHISFGAMGDSAYEYMLKQWLQGGRKEIKYRMMYDKSIQGLHDELLVRSTPSGLLYVAEKVKGTLKHKMDHLVCFLSGTLALGAYTDPYGVYSPRAQRDLRTAKSLAYTCYQMYARTKTGLAPEIVKFRSDHDFYIEPQDAFYILRPEAVESFFILNQLTGDPIYREWGWEVSRGNVVFTVLIVGLKADLTPRRSSLYYIYIYYLRRSFSPLSDSVNYPLPMGRERTCRIRRQYRRIGWSPFSSQRLSNTSSC